MNLNVFQEKPVEVNLKLEKCGDKVIVQALDQYGKCDGGNLLAFTNEGIVRYPSVNPKLGFPLDETGRLKLRQ